MADTPCIRALLTVPNGLSAPLYADGQVVRAADLTLDRSAHDAELWRLRRLLHGWGVVAGLLPELEGDSLYLHRGYGICPSGEEVLLPENIAIPGLSALILETCGPAAPGCGLDASGAPLPDTGLPLTVWLAIRPDHSFADLRASMPQGCDHPGNHVSPARQCGGATLELHCALPEGHDDPPPTAQDLREVFCHKRPVLMPDDLPEPGLLVLAAITWNGQALSLDLSLRRPLLPVSFLQDFVTAIGCPLDPPADPDPDPEPQQPDPDPQPDDGPQEPDPTNEREPLPLPEQNRVERDWRYAIDLIRKRRFLLVKDDLPHPSDGLIRKETLDALIRFGVTPAQMLTGNLKTLASQTGLSEQHLAAALASVSEVKTTLGSVRY